MTCCQTDRRPTEASHRSCPLRRQDGWPTLPRRHSSTRRPDRPATVVLNWLDQLKPRVTGDRRDDAATRSNAEDDRRAHRARQSTRRRAVCGRF
jgi:hypothetical protein